MYVNLYLYIIRNDINLLFYFITQVLFYGFCEYISAFLIFNFFF